MKNGYLPMNRHDMSIRGWKQCGFMCVSGDAYVDHSSFDTAIISGMLEAHGCEVGIIAQPGWKDKRSIEILGRPRLGSLVSAGNMDPMMNHYSMSKERRKENSYTPSGIMGKRPDYAMVVYCSLIRSVYKDAPIIIEGVEASLCRLAHYDYWSGKLERSVLLDSQADIISHGMGEHSIVEIADTLDSEVDVKDITFIDGTVYKTRNLGSVYDYKPLPDYTQLLLDKKEYARSFYVQYNNTGPFSGKRLVEPYEGKAYVVQNPPAKPLSWEKMGDIYNLPHMRNYHPSYEELGGAPAIREIKPSLISNRGCLGACSFCALTFHRERITQARSHESLPDEAKLLIKEPDFKGYIHDVDGPIADFRFPTRNKQMMAGTCPNRQRLFPEPYKNLKADHTDYISLLRKLRALPKMKKAFIRSDIRFDCVLADPGRRFLRKLCEFHVSGQLRVAPEHVADRVFRVMGKPKNDVYRQFAREYKEMNGRLGKKQYLVPYLMSSRPGFPMKEAMQLAEYLGDLGYIPEQVQDFYPTPSTISTCMYYAGCSCRTMEPVYVPVDPHEKAMQRVPIQYRNPKSYDLVAEALRSAGRTDLIGFNKKCLVRLRSAQPLRDRNGQPVKVSTSQGSHQGVKRPKKTIRNVHKKKGPDKMKIAVMTGASSGMGREIIIQLWKHFGGFDEIWTIARRMERLEELDRQMGAPLRKFALDPTKDRDLDILERTPEGKMPQVKSLVNAARFEKIGAVNELSLTDERNMVHLNCEALCVMTRVVLPCMAYNSRITQFMSSVAFLLQPGFATYAATKSFMLSHSRALHQELESRNVYVTAVCLDPVKTEFFDIAGMTGEVPLYKRLVITDPRRMVAKAIRDSVTGRDISVYGLAMKAFDLLYRVFPHRFILILMDVISSKVKGCKR